MNDLLNTLLGLDAVRFGVEGVRFGWQRPWPSWLWVVLIAGAAGVAWWVYRRLPMARRWRVVLGCVRGVTLVLVLVMLSGPALIESSRRVEPDWIMVLADRSASMEAADGPDGATRNEQLREALRAAWPQWSQRAERSRLVWLGFADGAFDLAASDQGVTLGDAAGVRTDLEAALDEALDRGAARSLAGIVVLSDGRSSSALSADSWDRLRAKGVPVFTVALGATGTTRDLAVTATAAARAFVDDAVPVQVRIDQVADAGEATPAVARLIDELTGRVLDERAISVDGGSVELTLLATPDRPGAQRWRVEIDAGEGDLVAENNTQELTVEVLDEPLRVVYLDGTPRWEHRYLKNLLLREDSITSSSLLLAARRRYTQEGNVAIAQLPNSPEEWADIDVVVLGDVRPELLGEETMNQLRDHIATRGAGLVWIGGSRATPHGYRGSPLAALLPFTLASQAQTPVWDDAVTLVRADASDALGVLRLGDTPSEPWPSQLSDPLTGWSRLWGVQKIAVDRLKPAAVPLAFAQGDSIVDARGWPVVMTMRYGAGRVVYLATDETWRWRYGLGDLLFDRFWLPIVRMAGRQSLARLGTEAALRIDPRQPVAGRAVSIELRLLDQALVDAAEGAVEFDLARSGEPDAEPQRVSVRRLGEDDPTFLGTWIPSEPGTYELKAATPLLAGVGLQREVRVVRADDERRDPRPDHALLASLAQRTGGRVVPTGELGALAEEIPNREVVVASPPKIQTLWDTPLMLVLLVVLLGAEWAGRRLLRLA